MNSSGGDWFESDAFWTRLFPIMFPDAQFTAAAENVSKIVALSGISDGSVLDLACGPGRYAVPFAKAGFQVTGVDRTRFLLDKARERATREGATIEWIEQDMREFCRPNRVRSRAQRLHVLRIFRRRSRESPSARNHSREPQTGRNVRLRASGQGNSGGQISAGPSRHVSRRHDDGPTTRP